MIKKLLLTAMLLMVCVIGVAVGLYRYENRRMAPDYFPVYQAQDGIPHGRVGVFVTGLMVPETFEPAFFYNVTDKITSTIIPWPFRLLARKDRGIALFDPERYCESEPFTPARLVNWRGEECDLDGEPFIEKYRRGEVVWAPPSKMIHKDNGYFIYTGRHGGMPSLTGKMLGKANLWYYQRGIAQQRIPHEPQTLTIISQALERLARTHPGLLWRAENSMHHHQMQTKLEELLAAGCDTIVLASPMAIYSHFEEFDSSFRHCIEYIHAWQERNPDRKITIIMAPQLGDFKPLRDAYVAMLRDRLDTLPRDATVAVAVTVHGLPYKQRSWEAWISLAPRYLDPLNSAIGQLLDRYGFARTQVMSCQDEFAGPVRDPEDNYLSTNEAYWQAIRDGFDYVIGLPVEFFAENSDTLFYHAIKSYEGLDGFDIYEPIDYPDWSQPYTREFVQGATHVIYNGVPAGPYQGYVVDALYASIDSVLQKGVK